MSEQRAKNDRDCWIIFDVEGNVPERFVQLWFSPTGFLIDLPNTILSAEDAEIILQAKPAFFLARIRYKSDDPKSSVNEFNPLKREYVYGEERLAAEDMAFIWFDVWKFPMAVRFRRGTFSK